MFTKQNTKQSLQAVMFTKQKKSLQTRYVYKSKYKTESIQNKINVYKHVCFQNKTLQTCYVYKTKYKTESPQNKTNVYKNVMFTKQNECLQH